jgi:hypothetical protein
MALEDLPDTIGLVSRRIGGIARIGQDVMAGVRAHSAVDAGQKGTGHLPVQLLTHPIYDFLGLL